MKTRISQFAAVLFLALVVTGNVNAIDYKVIASSHESTQETLLELENWMMDDDIWNTTDLRFVEAQEAKLEIEDWMTSSSIWYVQPETLKLENWMMDEEIWKVRNSLSLETEKDKDMVVENWMTNKKIWKV